MDNIHINKITKYATIFWTFEVSYYSEKEMRNEKHEKNTLSDIKWNKTYKMSCQFAKLHRF